MSRGPYTLEVYHKDGSRFEAHHCDGIYEMSSELWNAISTAVNDDDVGSVRVVKSEGV